MKLTIVDNTGRLTADPSTWPTELKQAIRGCCCGQGSSSGGTSSGNSSDGLPLDQGVCGCDVDVLSGWTKPLVATITSTLFGTFTVPLASSGAFVPPGISVEYNGSVTVGETVVGVMYNCPPGPNNCGLFSAPERYVKVKIQCAICPSAPFGKYWLCEVALSGQLGGTRFCSGFLLPEVSEHMIGYIAKLLACEPVVFEEHIQATTCPDQEAIDCCGAGVPDVIKCKQLARERTDGHTITVNISE